MFSIYIDSPVPDPKDLKEQFIAQLKSIQDEVPNFQDFVELVSGISVPNLLGLPDPIFSGYSNTLQEMMEIIDAVKYQADTLTMMNIFKPLASVIGGALEDIIPKIPVLNFSVIDIVNGEIQPLYTAVVEALKNGVKLPFLPLQLLENYSNYAKESLLALKMILVGYKEMLLTTMQGMIKDALKILDITGIIPTLLIVPSIDQLKQSVIDAFPEYTSWHEIITNIDISKITNIFGVDLFILPEASFIPNFSNYEQYLMEIFNQIKDHFLTLGLTMLVEFVENTLGVLGFSFPSFYIRF